MVNLIEDHALLSDIHLQLEPDRHSTNSAIDHDDNVQISLDVSGCQSSDVQITSHVSHDTCTNQDVTHETGFRKLGTKRDASQSSKILSRANTPEGTTTRYCGDQFVKHIVTNSKNTGTANMFNCQFDCDFVNEKEDIYLLHLKEDHGFEKKCHVQGKESCNQCEFTCETKGELERHTSVEHENCVQSGHADGTDKNKIPVEDIQKMFLCPFTCGFSNEDEDIFLIHLTENHGCSKRASPENNYEACHLCTFSCSTKKNPIISQLKADKKGLSHLKI